MKTQVQKQKGYALVMVICFVAITAIMVAATMNRTFTNARLNDRNNSYFAAQNAAESAVEKVVAKMRRVFQVDGLSALLKGVSSNTYALYYPDEGQSYWTNFTFSDGQGNDPRTYIGWLSNYVGNLPGEFTNFSVSAQSSSPVYRIISNVRYKDGPNFTAAVQEDVVFALVPIAQYAIFYNGLLEFSDCAPMTINGETHGNSDIYVGTISGSSLTFNGHVSAGGSISAPANDGFTVADWADKGTFNGGTNYGEKLSLDITNAYSHAFIDMPASTNEVVDDSRIYNSAQTILTITNAGTNLTVTMKIQSASGTNDLPGADANAKILTTNTWAGITNMFPFFSTNTFYDHREGKTVLASQVDVGKYASWVQTNTTLASKLDPAQNKYPTILYVADQRNVASCLSAVRLVNGAAPPVNGGRGFTVATPNPLYVLGNYNDTNNLASTNTSATVPCALMSDALTLLSPSWNDANNKNSSSTVQSASVDTVNAAILTGAVPSTGTSKTTFSGGVHNLPRLLEDWGGQTLWLNTSIMNLFNSTQATGQFLNPPTYYSAPTRHFSFDLNFRDPAKVPPGIPYRKIVVRLSYCTPPPNTINYNVVP